MKIQYHCNTNLPLASIKAVVPKVSGVEGGSGTVLVSGSGERGWFCGTGRCTYNFICGSSRHAHATSANGALHAGVVGRGWGPRGSRGTVS